MPPLIQLFGVIIGLYFLQKSFKLVKDKKESLFEFFLWSFLGVAIILTSIFPNRIVNVLGIFGAEKNLNALFVLAILTLFFLIFYTFKLNRNMMKMISRLNEEISILKYKNNSNNENSNSPKRKN